MYYCLANPGKTAYEENMDAYLNGKAEKQYERLNEPILSRITEAIDKLEKEPPEGDIVPIAGKHQHFRTRVVVHEA